MKEQQLPAVTHPLVGMEGLRVYHAEFRLRARQPLGFGPQPGAQIRGAIYNALSAQNCPIDAPPHPRGQSDECPVCYLLAREDAQAERGRDVPRPLIIEPPLGLRELQPGEPFVFGLKLVGPRAATAFPLIATAVEHAASEGFGRGRGLAALESVRAASADGGWINLSAAESLGADRVALSTEWVLRRAASLDPTRIGIRFLTPLALKVAKQTLRVPQLGPLVRRIHERCQVLAECYAEPVADAELPPVEAWRMRYLQLGALAEAAERVRCDTRWVDVRSGSAVKGHWTPISGLVGEAEWRGQLGPLLPWLVWGELVHAGKNVTKGGGWLRVNSA
ncbi:MAG: CRISPR system precrRNA processing endoribonuclease RAMP protein Cas6 [Anaerolineae bacterium]|nr:CRISPR system precrRNA processing endoribonuclease RAMP protein Cas6 [Anaerolineae bacterium]